jgi:hypothetical protein
VEVFTGEDVAPEEATPSWARRAASWVSITEMEERMEEMLRVEDILREQIEFERRKVYLL